MKRVFVLLPVLGLLAVLGGWLLPRPAQANIFGAAPSLEAHRIIQTCSTLWDANLKLLELRHDDDTKRGDLLQERTQAEVGLTEAGVRRTNAVREREQAETALSAARAALTIAEQRQQQAELERQAALERAAAASEEQKAEEQAALAEAREALTVAGRALADARTTLTDADQRHQRAEQAWTSADDEVNAASTRLERARERERTFTDGLHRRFRELREQLNRVQAPMSIAYIQEDDHRDGEAQDRNLPLVVRAAELRSRVVRDYSMSRCGEILRSSGRGGSDGYAELPSEHTSEPSAHPPLTTKLLPSIASGTGSRVHILVGASASGAAGGSDVAFAPSLGFSYSDNMHVFTFLIDPRLVEGGRRELGGSDARATLGREMLNPQLGAQSLYANYALYPWRIFSNRAVQGFNFRLVAQRVGFDVAAVSGEGEGESFDAYLLSPTASFALTSTGITNGDEELTIGFQVGLTGRFLAADFSELEEARTTLRLGDRNHGLWAMGADLSLFMQLRGVAPYVRMTVLHGPHEAPRSLKGFQMVFGFDVLAGLRLGKPNE